MLCQLEIQGRCKAWSPLCPPDRLDLLQPRVLPMCRSSCCHHSPSVLQGLKVTGVGSPPPGFPRHAAGPLWLLYQCFSAQNPTEGQPSQVFFSCESFLQLVHLRGACWGHSHPHGFPLGCFPQCLALLSNRWRVCLFSVENPGNKIVSLVSREAWIF